MFLVTGLGERLKEARTEKGYTLDDLQGITKIQKRYLSSIENEDFSTMPGAFYVRAFIKQYAEAVGLDADEMLSLYRHSSGATEIEEEEKALPATTLTRSSKRSPRTSKQLNDVIPKVIFALFIIVIIGVIYFLWINGESKKQQIDVGTEDPITVQDQQTDQDPTVTEEDEEDAAEEEVEEPAEPEEVAQTLTHVSDNGEDSTYKLTDAKEFNLEIDVSGESWVGVLDSARTERMPAPRGADVYNAGDTVAFDVSDTDSVRIRVGRTASVDIHVNGELLEYVSDRVTQNIIIEYEKEE